MNPIANSGTESPPADESKSPSESNSPTIWRAGTLTYTTSGLLALLFWLMWGDIAWSMKERSTQFVVQILLRKFNVSDLFTAVMMVGIPQAIAILLVPIVSYKSDRHRGWWGRRMPFLILPTPFAVLGLTGLAFSLFIGPRFSTSLGIHWLGPVRSTLLFITVFWMLYEISTIISNAVFGALMNDVVPPQVLGRFYGVYRAISLVVGIFFQFYLFGKVGDHYIAILLSVVALYLLGYSAMGLKIKEGKYPPVPENERSASAVAAVQKYFRECFANRYYYWVFATIVLPSLAFLPINTFNLYFSESVGMKADTYGKFIALYFFLSLFQTIPLGWLVDKFHPLRVAMVALVLHGSAALWGGVFIQGPKTFAVALVATGMLSGTWMTATAALLPALLPKMKFAQYSSALQIINSLTMMIFGMIAGHLLDLSHHQYRYTYLSAFYLDAVGLVATLVVFRKFLAMGGTAGYVAPE